MSVLSKGVRIHVEGIGWRTVADTGAAIRGKSVDILMQSHWQAKRFGKQYLKVEMRASD